MAQLLNLGCGQQIANGWVNVDLVARAGVVAGDIRRRLPFPDATCDAVYHSHVLEHLRPAEGVDLLRECLRVLRPGGRLRVVVPDLEQVARAYLRTLDLAAGPDAGIAERADHEWMIIELADQMVRDVPGGEMRRFVCQPHLPNEAFVRGRLGAEFRGMRENGGNRRPHTLWQRVWASGCRTCIRSLHRVVLKVAAFSLGGRSALEALDEGLFRQSGEVHRWMYDRESLRRLLESVGFVRVARCAADES